MIEYSSSKQISIENFIQSFGGSLSKDNRWVILANLLPWDEFVGVYVKSMSRKMGRKAINPRVAVGALIIKHILRSTDEDTIDHIKENPYLQYFLGYEAYRYEQPFTASLLVSIRYRLGTKEFEQLSSYFMRRVHQIEQKIAEQKDNDQNPKSGANNPAKAHTSAERPVDDVEKAIENKGHLIVDATVAPADIKYPTDLDLLNEAREFSEELIDLLYVGKAE
ncbi:MAG TPA: transposase [Caldithrix sp.]|nr:transposase [Caldithrix sp.]